MVFGMNKPTVFKALKSIAEAVILGQMLYLMI